MTRILVVDDEEDTRDSLVDILFYAGYDVIAAEDGGAALEKASREDPDVILLDVMMPVMDGFEVLARLRQDPATGDIPVIMLTALSAARGEGTSIELGVDHYITKPFDPDMVKATVRVALRKVGAVTTPIRSKDLLLDEKLGGGLPLGSLTLIGGASSAGKSVFCQHLAYGAVEDEHSVAYLTSENNTRSLVSQMGSLGLDIESHLRAGNLRICPLQTSAPAGESVGLTGLLHDMENLPRQYKVVIVGAVTNLAAYIEERAIMDFFSSCKRLCSNGRTIILVAHSHAFDEQMLIRLRSLCDAHLSFRVENVGAKLVKVLEVHKIQNAEGLTGNVVSFEVEPGIGMRIIPISKARA